MNTIFLNPATWDLTLDNFGNIALATSDYAIVQDVATACRTFTGDVWYNQSAGIPYLGQVLGQALNATYLAKQFQNAALTVLGVASALAIITGFSNRNIQGQVQITLDSGATYVVGF